MTLHFTALHSQDSADWYTPAPYVDAAREVMGGIDLDPASDAQANKTVKATTFFTEQQNGLLQVWKGRVFLNPPGKDKLVSQFWQKLMASEHVPQFIWIGYSLEQLQTLQLSGPMTPLNFPLCILKKRIAFVENDAKRALRYEKLLAQGKTPNPKSSPSHGNYIVGGGPMLDCGKFEEVFEKFGQIINAAVVLG